MQKISINDNVSKTLFLPLVMKVMENEEKNPILKDEFSKELMEKIDFNMDKYRKIIFSKIGTCQRAKYFDDVALEFIKSNETPVVVFVGCGLDTRYLRIKGDEQNAIFYELDLPEVIDFRSTLLTSGKNCEFIKCSMFETSWMDELALKHKNKKFLFIIEGVLMYFEKRQVKDFLINLSSRFKGEIAFDMLSVWASNNSQKHDTIKHESAKFKCGMDDEKEPESWSENIKLIEKELVMKQKIERFDWQIALYKLASLVPKIGNNIKLLRYKI